MIPIEIFYAPSALTRSFSCNSAIACATMDCRPGCGACCIAPSITSPIPGLPLGKPAGQACVQLDAGLRCRLFGQPERPVVCASLRPQAAMCGSDRQEALQTWVHWERLTAPG